MCLASVYGTAAGLTAQTALNLSYQNGLSKLSDHDLDEVFLAVICNGGAYTFMGAVHAHFQPGPPVSTAFFTSSTPHNLATGQSVVISGATHSYFNGTYVVTVIGPFDFSYTITNSGFGTVVDTGVSGRGL